MPLRAPLLLAVIVAIFKDRADLVAENLALRHQLSCLRFRRQRRPLRPLDRALWVVLSRVWCRWRELLLWIGGLRRDCLDHVVAINEDQLRRVVRAYVDYFHEDRTHLALEKDTPVPRAAEPPEEGKIVAFPRVGGLHHRYSRTERTAA